MISASFSLSLPRLGWKSTSIPRSLKICTAAGDKASEMRTLGLDIGAFPSPSPGGEGRREAPGGGEAVGCGILRAPNWGKDRPIPPHLRCVDPPPPGEGEDHAAFASEALVSAKAQSIHCVSSATSLASTVAPHQMRRPAGASR